MSHGVISQFLSLVSTQLNTTKDPLALANLLVLDPRAIWTNSAYFNDLRPAVQQNADSVEAAVEESLGDEWLGFNEVAAAYLHYVAACEPVLANPADPQRVRFMRVWFDRLSNFINALNAAFNTPRGGLLRLLIRQTTRLMIMSAVELDNASRDYRKTATQSCMNQVLRAFNASLTDRTIANPDGSLDLGKKAVTLDIGNDLFKLYFKVNQVKLCATIHKNISATDIFTHLSLYPKATVTTYSYYLGRHHFSNWRYSFAFVHLSRAYDLCAPHFLAQRRRILIYLFASGIIIGKFPTIPYPSPSFPSLPSTPTSAKFTSPTSLFLRPEAEGLAELFHPICVAVKLGDFRALRIAMGVEGPHTWKYDWLWRHALFLALQSRTHILCWRALVKRTYLVAPPDRGALPTVPFSDLLKVARMSFRKLPAAQPPHLTNGNSSGGGGALFSAAPIATDTDEEDEEEEEGEETWWVGGLQIGEDDVESVCISLISQGYVKGYIGVSGQERMLVLSKNRPFPGIAEVHRQRIRREYPIGEEPPKEEMEGNGSFGMGAEGEGMGGGMGGGIGGGMGGDMGGGGGRVVNLSGVKPIGQP